MKARGMRYLTLAMVLMVGLALVPAARAMEDPGDEGGADVSASDPVSEVPPSSPGIPDGAVWVACYYYAGDNQLWDNGSNKYMVTDKSKGQLAIFANRQCQVHGVFGPGTVEVYEAKDPLQALITRKGFFVRHSYGTSFEVVGSVPGAADEQGGGNSSRGWKVVGGGSFPDGLFDIMLMVTGRFYVDSGGYWVAVASATFCTDGAEEEEAVANADTTVVPGTEPDEDQPAADEPTAEGGAEVTDADAAEGQKPGDNVQQFVNDGVDGAQNVFNNLFDGAQNGAEHVGEFVSDTAQGIGNVAQNVGAGLQQIGQNVGNGLRQVGQNVAQGVVNATDVLVPNELNARRTRTGRLTADGHAVVVENTPFGTVMYGLTLTSSPESLQLCHAHGGEVITVTGRWTTQTVQKSPDKVGMGAVQVLELKGSWEE